MILYEIQYIAENIMKEKKCHIVISLSSYPLQPPPHTHTHFQRVAGNSGFLPGHCEVCVCVCVCVCVIYLVTSWGGVPDLAGVFDL
jgi:hypothetical protein